MAGAGAPIVTPLSWPVGYVMAAITKDKDDKPSKASCGPLLETSGHLTAFTAALRSSLLAYLCIYQLPQKFGLTAYPAFGPAIEFRSDWILHILTRNILATWLICGFWDWFLYFGPLKDKLHKYKMNPVYPSLHQIKHDAFWTTTASIFGSLIEIALCHLWATGQLAMQRNLMESPLLNLSLALLVTHYRIPHFYLVHRLMHPWKTQTIPDLGKILYRQVHSLHHKSYNPTAFSGTNMHPVESSLYYSAALIPAMCGLHPIHSLAVLIDCAMGAWLGHDGFQWPGSGDYFHLLHHAHFDCNYGSPHVPLDWLFGTFAGSKAEVGQLWKGQPSGEESNDTPVHEASRAGNKVE